MGCISQLIHLIFPGTETVYCKTSLMSNADVNIGEVVGLRERFKTINDDDGLPLNFNSAIQHRSCADQINLFHPFTLMAYKPNSSNLKYSFQASKRAVSYISGSEPVVSTSGIEAKN